MNTILPVPFPTDKIRALAVLLAFVFCFHSFTTVGFGTPLPSEIIATESTRDADLQTIQQTLEMKVVQQRLIQIGFSDDEIAARLERATDEELRLMAQHAEQITQGAGVVTVLLVVLLVIVILRLV